MTTSLRSAVPPAVSVACTSEHPRPRRRQLDGQGQALQPPAQLCHRRRIARRELKVRPHCPRPIEEEGHAGEVEQGRPNILLVLLLLLEEGPSTSTSRSTSRKVW